MGAFKKYLGNVKGGAKIRGVTWKLTDAEVLEITKKNCVYCGSEPMTKVLYKQPKQFGSALFSYTYNGIDRLNSNGAYEIGNVVPCCGFCNRAKREFSVAELERWLTRVAKNLGSQVSRVPGIGGGFISPINLVKTNLD